MKPDWDTIQFHQFLAITVFAWFILSLPLVVSLIPGLHSRRVQRTALAFAILLGIYGGWSVYTALSNEITGTAVYTTSRFSHEQVTRETSPTQFRRATNVAW